MKDEYGVRNMRGNKKKILRTNKRVDYSRQKKNKHQMVKLEIDNEYFEREMLEIQGLIICFSCDLIYHKELSNCPHCKKKSS